MRTLLVSLIACALMLSFVADARAQTTVAKRRPTERVRFGGELGFAVFLPSRYAQTLSLFGHGQLAVGTSVAARVTTRIADIVVIGGRVGLLHTGSLPPSSRSAIHYNLVDASLTLVIAASRRSSATGLLSEIGVEAGGVVGDASLDKVPQLVATFRAGGSIMVGGYFTESGAYAGVRVTAVYSPWNGAGGSFWDATFSNITASIEIGGIR